jgi:AcrR family transcriptional regulator
MKEVIIHEKTEARERILQKAEELFAEYGFEGTSIRMISKEAGVNIAMISYYFSSKEKLLEGLLEGKMKQHYDSMEEMIVKDENHFEVLKYIITSFVKKLFANHCFHKMLVREMSFDKKSALYEMMKSRMSRNREMILHLFKSGQRKGVFRKVDNELLMSSIFSFISYVAINEKLMKVVLNVPDDESFYSGKMKERIINHLYSMTESYLKP